MNINALPSQTLLITALLLFGNLFIWTLVSLYKKRADLADIAWGTGFFVVTWGAFFLSPFSYKSFIVNMMVTAWSLRLSWHIAQRNRAKKEDFRYQNLKKNWKHSLGLHLFFKVFLFQGFLLYVIALPLLWLNAHPENIGVYELKWASAFWAVGFLIEAVSDHQLARFQKDPSNQGKLLTTGLWRFVRHPNYLGELIQWWVFWALSANFFLLISPLLLTFLIIKVSGIAPLEKKMQSHPDFQNYAKITPSLIPFWAASGAIYTGGWLTLVDFGPKNPLISLAIYCMTYGIQLLVFAKYKIKKIQLSCLLSIYALFFGFIQETLFINSHLLLYPNKALLPPLWLLCLYPLFALNLNSSIDFINKNLRLCFFLGGLGALLSYVYAQKSGSVAFLSPWAYPLIFLSWGLYLVVIVWLNRKLNQLWGKYRDPLHLEKTLTVFFDQNCSICSFEMEKLKKRKQTGKVIYASLESEEEFKKKAPQIPYESARKKIHAIDSTGTIFKGIDALSEVYARTNFLATAVLLKAPGFHQFFTVAYAAWAKLRKYF